MMYLIVYLVQCTCIQGNPDLISAVASRETLHQPAARLGSPPYFFPQLCTSYGVAALSSKRPFFRRVSRRVLGLKEAERGLVVRLDPEGCRLSAVVTCNILGEVCTAAVYIPWPVSNC